MNNVQVTDWEILAHPRVSHSTKVLQNLVFTGIHNVLPCAVNDCSAKLVQRCECRPILELPARAQHLLELR